MDITKSFHSFKQLVATEKGKSNASSDQTCIISITINDINDNNPIFTASSYTAYAMEYLSDKPFESESILNVTVSKHYISEIKRKPIINYNLFSYAHNEYLK